MVCEVHGCACCWVFSSQLESFKAFRIHTVAGLLACSFMHPMCLLSMYSVPALLPMLRLQQQVHIRVPCSWRERGFFKYTS